MNREPKFYDYREYNKSFVADITDGFDVDYYFFEETMCVEAAFDTENITFWDERVSSFEEDVGLERTEFDKLVRVLVRATYS